MAAVKALGYVDLAVRDLERWHRLLTSVCSLQARSDNTDGRRQYRMDRLRQRIALTQSCVDQLTCIGWEVVDRKELDALAGFIAARGSTVLEGDAALARERGVAALYRFEAPDQVPMELFTGPIEDREPFKSAQVSSGFKTGELGLGHVVFASRSRQATVDWYCEVLGFRLTDTICVDGMTVTFLHCNRRHHSLGVMDAVDPVSCGDLGHFMLEANSIDDVGRAYDAVLQEGFPLALTLGRHTNDLTISFYVESPSGWWIEYGYGGLEVDDSTWQPSLHHATKIWGHQPPQTASQKVR